MSEDCKTFESHFGFPPPASLVELVGDESLRNSLPIVFRFRHVDFTLAIQYLLSLGDPQNYDVEHKRVAFAVSTDGFNLLVNLATEDLDILQDEYGDCDAQGITITDLLTADRSEIE